MSKRNWLNPEGCRPSARLPGYLDLRGKMIDPFDRELPMYLAQPEIGLVQIFLGAGVPHCESVRFYSLRRVLKPVHILDEPTSRFWCQRIHDWSTTWPKECFPMNLPRTWYSLLTHLSAIVTFFSDGRARLNFASNTEVSRWYAEGQWRNITKDDFT